METFDERQHEKHLAERYARLARYEAFDRFVDMALDGQIGREDAIRAFVTDQKLHNNVIPIDFTPRQEPPPTVA
jgi:hypothetical protein